MESPLFSRHNESPDQSLFDRLESTLQDPRAVEVVRRALILEESTNKDLVEYKINLEELGRRAANHIHSLNDRWPYLEEEVMISGWVLDPDAVKEGKLEVTSLPEMEVTSMGFDYYLHTRKIDEEYSQVQLKSVLKFAGTDEKGNVKVYTALPEDIHIEAMQQSLEHAESILTEHYPHVIKRLDDQLATIDPRNDIQVVRAFSDFILPADSNDEIDHQLLESVETYWRRYLELEKNLPVYIVAKGNYYYEVYNKGEGVEMEQFVTDTQHENLVTIDKMTFRTCEEEGNEDEGDNGKLFVHFPILQVRVHGASKDNNDTIRQYPLYTIEDIVSVRDISYKTIRPDGA